MSAKAPPPFPADPRARDDHRKDYDDLGAIGEAILDPDAFAPPARRGAPKSLNRYILPAKHRAVPTYAVRYDRAAEMIREVGPRILAGDRVDAILSGNFVFGDIFEALAVESGEVIHDLTLSTLSFGEENVVSLAGLMRQDYLGTLSIVVSDYWWSHNRGNVPFIYGHLDIEDRFQLAVAGVHSKIALLRIGSRRIVAHGSANLRSSRSLEALTIETNPELYDFHMGWHRDVLEHHATIRKPLRAQALFDHLTRKR